MAPFNYRGEFVDSKRIRILNHIYKERDRQDKLHPEPLDLPMRFVTISEEIGEIAQALQDNDMESIYRELIDTAASCVRMAEEVLTKWGNVNDQQNG